MKFNLSFVLGIVCIASIAVMTLADIGTSYDAFTIDISHVYTAIIVMGVPFIFGYYAKIER